MTDNELKELAAEWVNKHTPIFIVCESYGIGAFMAGYKAAIEAQIV